MIKEYQSVPLLSKEEVERRKQEQKAKEITENQDLAAPTTPKTIFVWNEQLGKFATQDDPHTAAPFGMFDGVNYNSAHNIKLTQFPKVKRDETGHPVGK